MIFTFFSRFCGNVFLFLFYFFIQMHSHTKITKKLFFLFYALGESFVSSILGYINCPYQNSFIVSNTLFSPNFFKNCHFYEKYLCLGMGKICLSHISTYMYTFVKKSINISQLQKQFKIYTFYKNLEYLHSTFRTFVAAKRY